MIEALLHQRKHGLDREVYALDVDFHQPSVRRLVGLIDGRVRQAPPALANRMSSEPRSLEFLAHALQVVERDDIGADRHGQARCAPFRACRRRCQ
jgi:hypothetical protein